MLSSIKKRKQKVIARINTRIQGLRERAEDELKSLIEMPNVVLSARGTNAGFADFDSWTIGLNPWFLKKHEEQFIIHTVGHEMAHLITVSIHGRRIAEHGKEWQKVMKAFGLPPDATHTYSIAGAPNIKHIWVCDCQEHHVDTKKHNRMKMSAKDIHGHLWADQERYSCNLCGKALWLAVD